MCVCVSERMREREGERERERVRWKLRRLDIEQTDMKRQRQTDSQTHGKTQMCVCLGGWGWGAIFIYGRADCLLQGHIYNFSRNYRSRIHFLKISQIFRHQKTGQRFGSTKFGRFRTRDYLCRRHERPMLVGVTRRRCVRRSFLLHSGASLYRSNRRSNPPLASHYGNKGGGM